MIVSSQGKAEFLNPAGSPKDRVALQILLDAERAGLIEPHRGDCVFEGTVGSTGISLATLCRAKGYRCSIVLPDDVATEKSALLEKLGAEVKKVRPRGIVDPRHFVNEARALAKSFGQYDSDHHQDLIGGSLEANENEVIAVQGPERGAEASGIPKSQARRPRGFFADQFETQSNFLAHYRGTGPEIWAQCGGDEEPGTLEGAENAHVSVKCHRKPQLDAFVAGAGTGGTLSGVAAALREREASIIKQALEDNAKQGAATRLWQRLSSPPQWFENREQSATSDMKQTASLIDPIRIVLADPVGSGLFNKVHHGVMYSATEAEGTRRRHQVDSIVEGIGMNRITRNLSFGVDLVDDAIRVQDEEAVRMSRWLSVRDGLFVGSSSCVNVIAAVKTALKLKTEWSARGKQDKPTVVTILCDSGSRHLSKFHNDQVLRESYGIELPADPMQVDISDLFC